MEMPVNQFKRAIASGKTLIGAWLMSGAPSTAEALGSVGFDFLVVDMEHTPIDTPQMIGILQAIAGTAAQAIVRPPWNDMVMVKRAMDAGAQTLLFPFVQNADEARRAVASTRYPPEGVRGVVGVSDEINQARLRHHEMFYGPAGAGSPDDIEIFERVQQGLQGTLDPWVNVERGMNREKVQPDGSVTARIGDELPQRSQFAEWKRLMSNAPMAAVA